ncbi:hypothetical protein TNCV_5062891 [Trichonephila clavipes]|nr:hypothetical protein TNCV_5062891 [Trichonephila clavipes]
MKGMVAGSSFRKKTIQSKMEERGCSGFSVFVFISPFLSGTILQDASRFSPRRCSHIEQHHKVSQELTYLNVLEDTPLLSLTAQSLLGSIVVSGQGPHLATNIDFVKSGIHALEPSEDTV